MLETANLAAHSETDAPSAPAPDDTAIDPNAECELIPHFAFDRLCLIDASGALNLHATQSWRERKK